MDHYFCYHFIRACCFLEQGSSVSPGGENDEMSNKIEAFVIIEHFCLTFAPLMCCCVGIVSGVLMSTGNFFSLEYRAFMAK